jgi:hypothetical protein
LEVLRQRAPRVLLRRIDRNNESATCASCLAARRPVDSVRSIAMMGRNVSYRAALIAAALVFAVHSPARAAVTDFTETFDTDAAGWLDNASAALTHGSDGGDGFVTDTFDYTGFNAGDQSPVLFRGNGSNDASGDAFVGDWIASGVSTFSFDVRHDFDSPLTFFVRFASPFNFPGAVAVPFTPMAGNTWTTLTLAIDPSSPNFVSFEGSDFNSVFSNIGNVQIGASIDENLAGQTATFDIDNVSVTAVPEPASMAILSLAGLALMRRRGRRIAA